MAKRISQQNWSPALISALIVGIVFVVEVALRRHGDLQFLEFRSYDLFVRWRAKAPSSAPLVLVEITEQDIQSPRLDYPIWDDRLAQLLQLLESKKPRVIGVDILRDMPVPKNAAHLEDLNRVLLTNDNIIMAWKLGHAGPPAVLTASPERTGFADFLVDAGVDKKIRRALLYAGDNNDVSLSMQIALHYLAGEDVHPGPAGEDNPGAMRLGKAVLQPFEKNDGAYVGADDAGFQILLDFRCPERFQTFTMSDAEAGRIPPQALRDQIVLVGVTADSVKDEISTPIRFDHRGIEVQAQIVHQLIRAALQGERPLAYWRDWQEDVWVLIWCLVGGMIGFWARSPWRFGLLIGSALAVLGVIAWQAFQAGWWIPLMAPMVASFPSAAFVTSYIAYHEKAQRSHLMQLFAKQVSPDIAEAIWEKRHEFLDGSRPRPQKLTATVLFSDFQGFTTTAEGLEPALLMDWLNEYMDAMAKQVMDNHGVIEKFIGDSIMAVFGIPMVRSTQQEIRQDAMRAVRCALGMQQELDRLNARWHGRGYANCGMRIGIHTGTLVAGSLGSADRMEYTVLGDTVNTASRLESFDKGLLSDRPCRILISEATRAWLDGNVETQLVGEMNLKGKTEGVTIHAVVGEKTRLGGQKI